MRTNKFFMGMTALVAAMVFTACSQDEVESSAAASKTNVISLSSKVAMTRAASDVQTTALSTSNQVGVFVINGNTTIANGDNNQHSVGANGDLSTSNVMNYPTEENATVNIYAYAPYASGMALNSDNSFSVSTDQSAEAGYLASDLLYASATDVVSSNNTVNLTFAHKLSQLQIAINNEANIDLSNATVTIAGTKIATTFNPSTGAIGGATGEATAIKAATGNVSSVYAIVVPQEIAAGTELVKIVAAGKQYIAKLINAATLAGSKAYRFTVKLSSSESPVVTVPITLSSTSITEWGDPTELGEATMEEAEIEPITLTATFQTPTPGSNASYSAPTYTWTGSTSNLMTVFEFANGELANYHTLKFTFNNLVDGPVRMGYYVGSTFTEFNNGYYSEGEKTVDLTALGIDLSTVTKIAFGGRSDAGSCDILASDVILIGNGDGSSSNSGNDSGNSGNDSGNGSGNESGNESNELTATFSLPSSNSTNASWNTETSTYGWSATNSNLLTCFEFSNGELANYSTLTFTYAKSDDFTGDLGMLRIGYYVDNAWTELGNGYGTPGTKTVDLTTISSDVRSTITKICIGGKTGTGSVVLSNMKLTK